jgi:hypothetical protein
MIETGVADLDRTIDELRRGASAILGDQYFGMYLYGSLATGGFLPARSDVDFLIATHSDLSSATIDELRRYHEQEFLRSEYWIGMLEGCYLPLRSLRKYNSKDVPRPTVHKRRFYLDVPGHDWTLQLAVLRECPSMVEGPPLAPYIDPVERGQISDAISHLLRDWWLPILEDPKRMDEPGYPPYTVLTMCRALHGIAHGVVVSKPEAVDWALSFLDSKWRQLIKQALQWTWQGAPLERTQVMDFLRFALQTALSPG